MAEYLTRFNVWGSKEYSTLVPGRKSSACCTVYCRNALSYPRHLDVTEAMMISNTVLHTPIVPSFQKLRLGLDRSISDRLFPLISFPTKTRANWHSKRMLSDISRTSLPFLGMAAHSPANMPYIASTCSFYLPIWFLVKS